MSVVLGHEHKAEPKAEHPQPPTPTPPSPTPPAHTPVPTLRSLARLRRNALLAAPLAVAAVAWGGASAVFFSLRERGPEPPPAAAAEPDGAKLFARHCANCHGEKGDGNGVTRLDPKARDFGSTKFKLATTANGVPTDDDLVAVVRRGVPGSAMPAFPEGQLSDDEARAVVGHVRVLTRAGFYEKLRQKAEKDGEDFDPGYAAKIVADRTQVGPRLPVPAAFPPPTAESLARGRQVYLKVCVQCHGPEGRGDGPQTKDATFKNEDGSPAHPRDFTAGVFKGGRDAHQLYARVVLGMPGTPMPANNTLPPQEVADVIGFVLSLSRPAGLAAPAGVAAAP